MSTRVRYNAKDRDENGVSCTIKKVDRISFVRHQNEEPSVYVAAEVEAYLSKMHKEMT